MLMSQGALASTGCDAVNSGVFNAGSGAPIAQAGFDAGDTLDITITTSSTPAHYRLTAAGFGDLEHTDFFVPTSTTRSYTLTAAQLSLTLERISLSTTATCTPVVVASTTSDSDKARAVQIAGSRIAGQTSGHAISSATGSAINHLFNGPGPGAQGTPPSNLGGPFAAPNGLGARPHAGAVPYDAGPRASLAPIGSPWRMWGDVRGTDIRDSDATVDLKSEQINVTAGIGRRLGSNHAAGLLAGYEDFRYAFTGVGTLRGEGATVGTYFGMRLMPRLLLDAMVAYTRLEYDVVAGTASGSFDADRWLGSIGVTGGFAMGPRVLVEPSVRIYLLRESQDGWTDSLGTAQAARDFTEGRVSVGAKATTWMPVSAGMLAPYVGLYGEYDFGSDNGMPSGVLGLGLNDGWSMRATAGVSLSTHNGFVLSLGGDVGGIGGDYLTQSVRAGAAVAF